MSAYYISDDAFAYMVAQEVKNKSSEEQRHFLEQAENLDRWVRCLNALLENINDQISEATEDMRRDEERYAGLGEDGLKLVTEAKIYYESKINKAERFRFFVVKRISEVESILFKQKSNHLDSEKMAVLHRDAIIAHRRYLATHDIETTHADDALYRALEGVWSFEDLPAPEEEKEGATQSLRQNRT